MDSPGGSYSRYIVLLSASASVAGKVQIAKSVANALSCPLYQGDSMHETCAKAAAAVGTRNSTAGVADDGGIQSRNETRYRRMWLSKMTRTGLLFPEESRPATGGFSGFGGRAASISASSSRRGSNSSTTSVSASSETASVVSSAASSLSPFSAPAAQYINKPPPMAQIQEKRPILMVITHPELDHWHKSCIHNTLDDYGIGVIFVPLNEDDRLPVPDTPDPKTITSFDQLGSFGRQHDQGTIVLRVDVDDKVEELVEQIIAGVKDILRPL